MTGMLENSVSVYDGNGKLVTRWGNKAAIDHPEAIAVDGRGHVLVMSTRGIHVFDAAGNPLGTFGNSGRDMAVATDGKVYVLGSEAPVTVYALALPPQHSP
jgi:DNA-binding beta-propeller fold protein YncE